MEVRFAPFEYEDKKKQSIWSNEKLKNLWASLLNLDSVSKACDDVELQGILLLLETTFSIFRSIKEKRDEYESANTLMKHDLEATREDLFKVKEELRRCKLLSCERCKELEKELSVQKKKFESNENRIKSIVSILSLNNSSEDSERNTESQHTVVAKAYNLVSQMLLGDDVKCAKKREHQDFLRNTEVRTPGKKKSKVTKEEFKPNILGIKGVNIKPESELVAATLVPATLEFADHPNNFDEPRIIPETLVPESQVVTTVEKSVEGHNIKENCNENRLESTPKKQVTQGRARESSSPILCGSNKKPAPKGVHGHSSSHEDSSDEHTLTSQTCGGCNKSKIEEDDELKSPSLLKLHSGALNSVVETDGNKNGNKIKRSKRLESKTSHPVEECTGNVTKTQADCWKLKSTSNPNLSRSGIDRSKKLKQTTLSLARFPKKQDLCTLKEFNGGIRQSLNDSDSFLDLVNGDCDEETSLQLAIQESLNGNENVVRLETPRAKRVESAEDDDDFICSSPKARRRNQRTRHLLYRKDDSSSIISPKKKQNRLLTGKKDTDETMFIPLCTSTMKDSCPGRNETRMIHETADDSASEKLLKELACPAEEVQQVSLQNSFDRIPEKVSRSPNYKYRRDVLRKKEARQKLDGWDCAQCKNYYALAGVDLNSTELKQRLKLCSKHRDKYAVESNTPPGYWNIQFPDTEMSIRTQNKIKL